MEISNKLKRLESIEMGIKNISYDNDSKILKEKTRLVRFINKNLGDYKEFIKDIEGISFYSSVFFIGGNQNSEEKQEKEFWEKGVLELLSVIDILKEELKLDMDEEIYENSNEKLNNIVENKKVFIIHGHDDVLKNEVKSFIYSIKLQPIILSEENNYGDTIIEKFERQSNEAMFAIALFTDDDQFNEEKRARQNVIFEYGYFIGKLGRRKTFYLKKGDITIPSDIQGIAHSSYDEDWRRELFGTLRTSGFDLNFEDYFN